MALSLIILKYQDVDGVELAVVADGDKEVSIEGVFHILLVTIPRPNCSCWPLDKALSAQPRPDDLEKTSLLLGAVCTYM